MATAATHAPTLSAKPSVVRRRFTWWGVASLALLVAAAIGVRWATRRAKPAVRYETVVIDRGAVARASKEILSGNIHPGDRAIVGAAAATTSKRGGA